MSNPSPNHGNPHGSWLTDIEKIQTEIARDLELTGLANEVSNHEKLTMPPVWTPPYEALAETSHESSLASLASFETSHEVPAEMAVKADEAEPYMSVRPAPSFYTETIKSKRQDSRFARTLLLLLLVCTIGMGSLGFGLGAAWVWGTGQTSTDIPEEPIVAYTPPAITSNRYSFEAGERAPGTLADMVELLESSVVSITTTFDDPESQVRAGTGTIFDETEDRILIVTGNYVVAPDASINVRISGSSPMPARFLDADHSAGLAVIAVYKTHLINAEVTSYTIAVFGNSSEMQVGDVVFALGNARNEGISVTRGIVSAGVQELRLENYTLTVLQTDAAINYGSSGGPLVNMNGEVIGINIDRATALFGSAAIEGIGYSIVSNVVLSVVEDLLNPERPALGIVGLTVTEPIALELGVHAMGVFVQIVNQGGAAYYGGIQPYDIITGFGGAPVFAMDELITAIRGRRIGDTVEVQVLRNGEEHLTLEVELKALIR